MVISNKKTLNFRAKTTFWKAFISKYLKNIRFHNLTIYFCFLWIFAPKMLLAHLIRPWKVMRNISISNTLNFCVCHSYFNFLNFAPKLNKIQFLYSCVKRKFPMNFRKFYFTAFLWIFAPKCAQLCSSRLWVNNRKCAKVY